MFGGFLNEAVIGSVIEINQIIYRIIPGNDLSLNSISLFNPENSTYLRHRFGVLFPSSKPDQDTKDPNFNADSSFIPELKLNGIILKCSNPGFNDLAVSEQDGKLIISQTSPLIFSPRSLPRTDDTLELSNQIYRICPANNGKPEAFSFRLENSTAFLRHSFGRLTTADKPDPDTGDINLFNNDSSFILCPAPEGFRLRCTNKGLEDHYVSVNLAGETVIASRTEIETVTETKNEAEPVSETETSSADQQTEKETPETETISALQSEISTETKQLSEDKETAETTRLPFPVSTKKADADNLARKQILKYAPARIIPNREQLLSVHRVTAVFRELSEVRAVCAEMNNAVYGLRRELQSYSKENPELKQRLSVLENLTISELNRKHTCKHDNPLISVIVPVFNGEKFLRACLNSLLSQTLADFELIIVNDGSTDGTGEILKEFSLRDERLKIIATDHRGAGEARNRGLEEIRGKYVSILDADDIYDPRMLLTLYASAEAGNLDITVCRSEKISDDNESSREKMNWTIAAHLLPESKVFSSTDASAHIFQLFNGWTWDKLFSSEFITSRRLKFQDIPFSNDAFFTYMALCNADRIGTVDEYLVIHRYHANSIEARRHEDPVRFIDVFRSIHDELEKCGKMKLFGISFCNWVVSFSRWQFETLEPNCRKKITDTVSEFMEQKHITEGLTRIYRDADTLWLANQISSPVPEVSVIMPVFNSEKYLEETVRSVREQTMRNFEVICVDDGSTDGSWYILQKASEGDPRFKIARQENRGAGAARNRGLELARGRYLAFIDSDDICEREFLSKMLARAKRFDADVTVCRYIRFFDEHNTEELPGNDIDLSLLPAKEVFSLHDIRKNFFQIFIPVVWNKLFRREFIEKKKIRFQELRNSNDTFFVYCALLESDSITTVNERLIRYRMRADSLVRTRRDAPDCYLQAQQALKEKVESMGLMEDEEFRKSLELRITRNTEWNRKMASA